MNNKEKMAIVIFAIIIIFVVVVCTLKNDKKETNITNEIVEENIIANDIYSENMIDENKVEEVENKVEEPIIENVTKVEPQGTVYESNSNVGTTDKKQEAINLVKQTWGEDDTVTFRCDSVNSKGEYIIAVVSKESASVKNYFKVNLNTKTVEVDY